MTRTTIKVLTEAEAGQLHNALLHGRKKELAQYMNIAPSALSRHLNKGRFGYRMPATVYEKILEFIKLKNLNHGKIPAA
jgi:hypothetical protein